MKTFLKYIAIVLLLTVTELSGFSGFRNPIRAFETNAAPKAVLLTDLTYTICEGESIDIFGNLENEPGLYTQVFMDANGGDSTVNITLEFFPSTLLEFAHTICEGEAINIFGNLESEPGLYTETFINSHGCQSERSAMLTVLPAAGIDLMFTICEGESIEIFGIMESEPGLYKKAYPTANGCDSIVKIQLIQKPFLGEIIISPETPSPNQVSTVSVEGLNMDTEGWPYSYKWSFDNQLTNATVEAPGGIHSVSITSGNGCEFVFAFEVEEILALYIPNSFSPNYDGINDYFTIYAAANEVEVVKKLMIFTRWGELIFEKSDFQPNIEQEGWNGRIGEQKMEKGAYVYLVELETKNGKTVRRSGDVVINY